MIGQTSPANTKTTSATEPIPTFRTRIINDPSELPDHYSQTPNGTLYSTTPGGTRIKYARNELMNLKNSPLARSPPNTMAFIPGVTNIKETADNNYYCKALSKSPNKENGSHRQNKKKQSRDNRDTPQFDMDM